MHKSIGENIKEFRTRAKLTQKELGIKINKGERTIRGYEANNPVPSIEILNKISEALNTDLLSLTNTNEVLEELGINPEKVFAKKNTDGKIEINIQTPVKKTITQDESYKAIREYVQFIAEQNDICMYSNEIDQSLPSIKEFIDTFIKHKLLEDHTKNRGTQIK